MPDVYESVDTVRKWKPGSHKYINISESTFYENF